MDAKKSARIGGIMDKNATAFSCENCVIILYNKHGTILAKIKMYHAIDVIYQILVACKKKLEEKE